MAIPNKSKLKNLEKRERGRIQGLPKCFGYPLLSQERVKLRTSKFKFCRNIHRVDRNKSPWKILGIVAVGVVRESQNFSWHWHPHIGRIAGHLCDSTAFTRSSSLTLHRAYRNLYGFARFPGDSTALVCIWQNCLHHIVSTVGDRRQAMLGGGFVMYLILQLHLWENVLI